MNRKTKFVLFSTRVKFFKMMNNLFVLLVLTLGIASPSFAVVSDITMVLILGKSGVAPFDARLDALARLVRNVALQRGHADDAVLQAFFEAGWNAGNLVDVMVVIGDKTVSNYLHSTTKIPVDFPAAVALTDAREPAIV